MALTTNDFEAFYEAIHHRPPFPWQSRLVAEAAQNGWPALLDLPTGVGKTSALDIAVFLLALDADKPPPERIAARRILMVIDRRTVVDQAFEEAKRLKEALLEPGSDILKQVATKLSAMSAGGPPLDVAILRGGMPRDEAWARTPVQPLIAVSTVDQVGSRLLFRGYGVSRRMRPVHAGLLGNDTLLLLDEVHLSNPFAQTLEALEQRYMKWNAKALTSRFHVVHMSATPAGGAEGRRVFQLEESDRANAVLSQRLSASKPAECIEVKVAGAEDKRRVQVAAAAAKLARENLASGRVVAIVVNRVATARAAHSLLSADPKLSGASLHLLTGRMRPLDRRDLEREVFRKLRSGRERLSEQAPIVIVSTQCIEAGADFDFDTLITECASLDALRQRFGRLNRLGQIDDARGFILGRSDATADMVDPIYGTALGATWEWLRSQGAVDFGIDSLALPTGQALIALLAPRLNAPVLLPAHLDRWAQTTVEPVPDPDVSLWLHGQQRGEPEVRVIWRADLTQDLILQAPEQAIARVGACPPSGLEALSLPRSAVLNWLSSKEAVDMADVEGQIIDEKEGNDKKEPVLRPYVAWRGEDTEINSRLWDGDTIVVPAAYGGLTQGSWDPDSTQPVRDRGDEASFEQRGRATLRLHPTVVAGWTEGGGLPQPRCPVTEDDDEDDAERARAWLRLLHEAGPSGWLATVVPSLLSESESARGLRCAIMPASGADDSAFLVLLGRKRIKPDSLDATTEDDTASHLGFEVPLVTHMTGVGKRAESFAFECGLDAETREDVAMAARYHDVGKADPRFQRMLRGGSLLRVQTAPEVLAKSAIPAGDWVARQQARQQAGYPKGGGHELLSVAMLAQSPLQRQAHDWPLVLHLVGSHHGGCRPIAPFIDDANPVDVAVVVGDLELHANSSHGLERLDSGVTERFWSLNECYGWHGLAWLEAIVRLSDHRQSEEEQNGVSK